MKYMHIPISPIPRRWEGCGWIVLAASGIASNHAYANGSHGRYFEAVLDLDSESSTASLSMRASLLRCSLFRDCNHRCGYIDSSDIEVLVNSPFCGRFNYTKVYANRSASTLLASIRGSADTYALNCYKDDSSLPALCRNTYVRSNISFSASPAQCPWNITMCSKEKLPALEMDLRARGFAGSFWS